MSDTTDAGRRTTTVLSDKDDVVFGAVEINPSGAGKSPASQAVWI